MNPQFDAIFAEKKLRMTTPRRAVFEAMRASEVPLSTGEITKKCPSIDRVSVYRTIELFVSLNIAESITVGWKQRFELTNPFQAHHHHLYCTNCAALIDIHSKKLEQLVASITSDYDFVPIEHRFEISGLCRACNITSPHSKTYNL